MKGLFFTIITIFSAFALTPNTKPAPEKTEYEMPPQDVLLKSASFDNAQFAIYQSGAEAVINGMAYTIEGDGYLNALRETEIVESPTGRYIVIADNGVVRFDFGTTSGVFVPAENEDGK